MRYCLKQRSGRREGEKQQMKRGGGEKEAEDGQGERERLNKVRRLGVQGQPGLYKMLS